MKRILAIALFGIASTFTVRGASAQASRVQAVVPFNFTVGGHMLPADTYIINTPHQGMISIQSVDNKQSHAFVLTHQAEMRPARDGKLVFVKSGDHYVLRQVLCPLALMNVDVATPRLEKSRRRQSDSTIGEFSGEMKGEMTFVAAR